MLYKEHNHLCVVPSIMSIIVCIVEEIMF